MSFRKRHVWSHGSGLQPCPYDSSCHYRSVLQEIFCVFFTGTRILVIGLTHLTPGSPVLHSHSQSRSVPCLCVRSIQLASLQLISHMSRHPSHDLRVCWFFMEPYDCHKGGDPSVPTPIPRPLDSDHPTHFSRRVVFESVPTLVSRPRVSTLGVTGQRVRVSSTSLLPFSTLTRISVYLRHLTKVGPIVHTPL